MFLAQSLDRRASHTERRLATAAYRFEPERGSLLLGLQQILPDNVDLRYCELGEWSSEDVHPALGCIFAGCRGDLVPVHGSQSLCFLCVVS